MSFIEDLWPIATSTVVATPVTTDIEGKETDGTPINLTHCHIEQENQLVTDAKGREVVSHTQVISLEVNNFSTGEDDDGNEWRFTLPADAAPPRTKLIPINILPCRDETGVVVAEEIQL